MKRNPYIGKWLAIGLIYLFVGTCVIPIIAQTLDQKLPRMGGQEVDHKPIYINGNKNFTSENGVTDGSGTADDPYCIEKWIIHIMEGSETAITIKNTDAYFVIRNCWIYQFRDGIVFQNVTNGVIENTTIERCIDYAIRTSEASSIMIHDNTILSTTWTGMNGDNNIITRNVFGKTIIYIKGDHYLFSYNTLNQSICYIGGGRRITGGCRIYSNNFITNTSVSFDIPVDNSVKFRQNYWGEPYPSPKAIHGKIYRHGDGTIPVYHFPWLAIDWRPALKPYEISV